MTAVDLGLASSLGSDAATCAHCGLDVPSGAVQLGLVRQFCCSGCRVAYEILDEHGLGEYYDFAERRNLRIQGSGREYAEFDHAAFAELYVRSAAEGLSQVELYLEGVHCASCVWLLERVPLILPGVASAELDLRRSRARITWDAAALPLSAVARMLDSLGYAPHPFRGVARDAVRRSEDRAMLIRIGVAGAIAMNVMLATVALYSGWLHGIEAEYGQLFRWTALLLVSVALVWPGRVFFAGARASLRARVLHMDVPIALGLGAGYAQGLANTINGNGPVYFDGLATLVFALLVGRYVQQRGQRAAADGAELLYSLTPSTARLIGENGQVREVPAQALLPGMLIDVRPGDTLPADGVMELGDTKLDLSLLTGESQAVAARGGSRVFAGTVNLSSPIRVRVNETGEASRVGKILRQVEEASLRRAPVVQLANRMAAWFVATVLVLALSTFIAWRLIDPTRAADAAIALLIVTCPCALALSTPLAVSMAIARAARAGIFVKGGDVIECLARPGVLMLDKTGTVTESRMTVVDWDGDDRARWLVQSLEAGSSHPIAAAFRRAWPEVQASPVVSSLHHAGSGVEGTVEGHRVLVGSPAFIASRLGRPLTAAADDRALTQVWVAVDDDVVGRASLRDPIRPDSASAVAALRARGWATSLLSGDRPHVVETVGAEIGIERSRSRGAASPEDKLRIVEAARARQTVVMVGDGVNDAAAIAAASVGIGVHGGAEACLASADVYLTTPGLQPVVRLMDGARRTMRVIQRNVAFSLLYNLVGAGAAMTGRINPLIAAILMPLSSLTVVLTSWKSRTFDETLA